MQPLFPEIKPYATHQLAVDPPHLLHVEESGSPDGIPVLFIHGGPGAGSQPSHRRFFDPLRYRIVVYDQRGAGHSIPHASLENNTTDALVADIERIREFLGIDRWVIFGGSWGSTLGLVYAESYPERVLSLMLRGIFLCRDEDIQWFYQHGASRIFPDYWDDFVEPIPESERGDMVKAYYRLLTGDNEIARMHAAKSWSVWEGRSSTLRPNHEVSDHFGDPHVALAMARIESHFFINNSFLKPNQIITNADRLKDIPGVIVHGRYDVVCPVDNAFTLHAAWPDADLQIIRDAGHSAFEPSITDALVRATNEFAEQFDA